MKTADAIQAFGTKAAIAQALNITPQAVSYWGDEVPELRAYQLRDILAKRADAVAEVDAKQAAA
jgi:hypothetical protein